MADAPALPSKDHFFAHHISIIYNCSICQDDFDNKEHAPARLCGPNSCHHVFGINCLKKWLDSDMPGANKCPMCRKELFMSDNGEYESEDEYDSDGGSHDESGIYDEEQEPILFDDSARTNTDDENEILGYDEDAMDIDSEEQVADLPSDRG